MSAIFRGRGAVLTGPTTPLSATVARRLGNEGATLVFAGLNASRDENIRALMNQFRSRVTALDVDLSEPTSVFQAIEQAERLNGRVDFVIHTLGTPEAEVRGHALVMRNSTAPMRAALTCTRGAMIYMRGRRDAQILHLISASQIGAMEVERVTLDRLQESWGGSAFSPVALSAIYFDESAAMVPSDSSGQFEPPEIRLLESFTGRLLEEDSWSDRVMLEREIGDMVVGVCRGVRDERGSIQAFGFHRGARAFENASPEMMNSLMA